MPVIAVDIGGTKTRAVLYDDQGSSISELMTGTCHLMNEEEAVVRQRLQACRLDATSPIVIGYAGYGKSEQLRTWISRIVSEEFAGRKVTLMSDIDLVMYSCLKGRDGTAVILGTGSIVINKRNNVITQKGGWGYLLGDEGSGYAIGLAALKQYVLEAEDRSEKSILSTLIPEKFELQDPRGLLDKVMIEGRPDRTKIASAARIVLENETDIACRHILTMASLDVCNLILSAADPGEEVIAAGGLSHSEAYLKMINERAEQRFFIRKAEHEPVYGGYVKWLMDSSDHTMK